MKVLVCGSRNFNDMGLLTRVLDNIRRDTSIEEILEGEARGADSLAREYGQLQQIPVRKFPADWGKHGKAAGTIRNTQMLVEGKPDLVVAFLAKDSKGTKNMIEQAQKANVPVRIVEIDHEPSTTQKSNQGR